VTLLVGIVCSDGIVIATDSFATYAQGTTPTIGQQPVTKVQRCDDTMIYAFTGPIGIAQILAPAFDRLAKSSFTNPATTAPVADGMKIIATRIREESKGFFEGATMVAPLVGRDVAGATVLCKSLVGVCWGNRPRLFQFDFSGAPEEVTDELRFVTLGSGQNIADPFLAFLKRVLWRDRAPTVGEGRLAAAWTVHHVSQTNFGGVGGDLQMATLTLEKGRPRVEVIAEPGEHYQKVQSAEAALLKHVSSAGEAEPAAPEPPVPPPA
jgi:20S proteasome alpha/beta subunit